MRTSSSSNLSPRLGLLSNFNTSVIVTIFAIVGKPLLRYHVRSGLQSVVLQSNVNQRFDVRIDVDRWVDVLKVAVICFLASV